MQRHERRMNKIERFSGFVEKGYRFEVTVPTTIFESKVACIRAYEQKRAGHEYKDDNVAAERCFRLKEMPTWNTLFQCIELSEKDMNNLEKITKRLVKSLPSLIK